MAEISDKDIPQQIIPATFERQSVRVKLNGTGGQFPNATITAGDIIHAGFAKNAAALAEVQDTYKVKYAASTGKRLVVYCILKLEEEDIIA
jgi:hypothetical protein